MLCCKFDFDFVDKSCVDKDDFEKTEPVKNTLEYLFTSEITKFRINPKHHESKKEGPR